MKPKAKIGLVIMSVLRSRQGRQGRARSERALSVSEREKLDAIAVNKPTVDITMQFDYNSDVLKGEALQSASELGRALTSAGLKGKTFVIAGHTDAKGSDSANLALSKRRALAFKNHLVRAFSIDPLTLIVVGYGKTRLKIPDQPFAAENRRVQAVNVMPTISSR